MDACEVTGSQMDGNRVGSLAAMNPELNQGDKLGLGMVQPEYVKQVSSSHFPQQKFSYSPWYRDCQHMTNCVTSRWVFPCTPTEATSDLQIRPCLGKRFL